MEERTRTRVYDAKSMNWESILMFSIFLCTLEGVVRGDTKLLVLFFNWNFLILLFLRANSGKVLCLTQREGASARTRNVLPQ